MTMSSGFRSIFASSPFSLSRNSFQSPFGRVGKSGLAARLSIKESSEAVQAELHASAKKAAGTMAVEASAKAQVPGAAYALFSEMRSLSSRLSAIDGALTDNSAGSILQDGLIKEKEALSSQLSQLLQGDTLRSFTDLASNVQSMMQSGASPAMISRALQSQRGLVGDGFLAAVQNGDAFSIGEAASAASGLLELGTQDLATIPGVWSSIESLAQKGITALSTHYGPRETAEEVLPMVEGEESGMPQATSTFLDLPGKLSLQITSYTGADLIKAVKAHVLPDARDLMHLIIDPPKKEKEKAEEQKL